jgi:hypothetical protein
MLLTDLKTPNHNWPRSMGRTERRPQTRSRYLAANLSSIVHLECDVRGRERTIVVTVIGDERQSTCN